MAQLSRPFASGTAFWRQSRLGPRQALRMSHAAAATDEPIARPDRPSPLPPYKVPRQPAATPQLQDRPTAARRRSALRKEARPFSDFLTDTFARQHDYLRISLTERCNLRCLYCMPEEGVPLSPPRELLTTPEIVLLSSLFVSEGVTKIRLTGGEPTVRRDILPLMRQLGGLKGLRELCLTTNGVALHRKLDAMVEAGLTGVNLSLDTLDPYQFHLMTRRPAFDAVRRSLDRVLELNRAGAAVRLKINCVVMRGLNDAQILPFVELTRHEDLEVRFIEYMPFDGNRWSRAKMLPYSEMVDRIRAEHPTFERVPAGDHPNDTSKGWRVPGFTGRVGFITSMTHNFCGTCNRLRVTSDGNLKVCLFGNAEVSLRDVLRRANGGEPIDENALEALRQIEADRAQGVVGNDQPLGLAASEAELLEVIGAAVKRKKAKHAGMGELEHMKNRPMILIDPISQIVYSTARTSHSVPGWTTSNPRRIGLGAFPWVSSVRDPLQARLFASTRNLRNNSSESTGGSARLTHVSGSGTARMVAISEKSVTSRTAKAACVVRFSNDVALKLVSDNQMKKGDVLGVARVAGIMAAKRTPDLIPLCHPIPISHASVDLRLEQQRNSIEITATVSCDGKTGVEMEALTAASTAALTVYDMCKAVDKGMIIENLRVILKDGGKSGRWEMP